MKQVVGINVRGEGTGLLSVVVPAYNDEKSLAAVHECLRDVVDKIPMETEIIYVIRDENGWRYVNHRVTLRHCGREGKALHDKKPNRIWIRCQLTG